jgi:hypothetical protein
MRIFLLSILLTFSMACTSQQSPQDKSLTMTDDEQLSLLEAKNQEGIIDFWEGIKKYTISYSQPGTIDSQITLVVDDLPEEFQKPGMKVRFSGTYEEDANLPKPMMGGQKIYLCKLGEISKVEE